MQTVKSCIKQSSVSLLLPLSLRWPIFVWHLNLLFLPVWAMWFIFLTSIQFFNSSSHWTPTAINQEVSLHIPVLFPTLSAFSTSSLESIHHSMDEWTSKLGIWFWSDYTYLTPWGCTVCAPLLFLHLAKKNHWKQENKFTMIKSEINNWSVSFLSTMTA